jgi:uncharacterized protein YjiS (DUF1127 family)
MNTYSTKDISMLTKIIAVLTYLISGEGSIVRRIQESQTRRVSYWQLKNLTDKDLRDIGLNRADIYKVAYGGRGRE